MAAAADEAYRDRLLKLVGSQEPLASLEKTARTVRDVAARLGPAGLLRRYGPGKWSGRQVLAHLADAELAIGFRIRQILSEDGHRVQPFDQEKWAARYEELDPEVALRAFSASREWNLALLRHLTPADLARETVHPERGAETLATVVLLLAGHDLNHLGQLEALLDQR
jgi:uncharacterized damage-inducible protein DinB